MHTTPISQSSRFPTAGQGERSPGNEIDTTPEKFENTTVTDTFGFVVEEISGEEIPSSNVLCPHENATKAFSVSSRLMSVSKSSVFVTDYRVCTEGLTGEIKLRRMDRGQVQDS